MTPKFMVHKGRIIMRGPPGIGDLDVTENVAEVVKDLIQTTGHGFEWKAPNGERVLLSTTTWQKNERMQKEAKDLPF